MGGRRCRGSGYGARAIFRRLFAGVARRIRSRSMAPAAPFRLTRGAERELDEPRPTRSAIAMVVCSTRLRDAASSSRTAASVSCATCSTTARAAAPQWALPGFGCDGRIPADPRAPTPASGARPSDSAAAESSVRARRPPPLPGLRTAPRAVCRRCVFRRRRGFGGTRGREHDGVRCAFRGGDDACSNGREARLRSRRPLRLPWREFLGDRAPRPRQRLCRGSAAARTVSPSRRAGTPPPGAIRPGSTPGGFDCVACDPLSGRGYGRALRGAFIDKRIDGTARRVGSRRSPADDVAGRLFRGCARALLELELQCGVAFAGSRERGARHFFRRRTAAVSATGLAAASTVPNAFVHSAPPGQARRATDPRPGRPARSRARRAPGHLPGERTTPRAPREAFRRGCSPPRGVSRRPRRPPARGWSSPRVPRPPLPRSRRARSYSPPPRATSPALRARHSWRPPARHRAKPGRKSRTSRRSHRERASRRLHVRYARRSRRSLLAASGGRRAPERAVRFPQPASARRPGRAAPRAPIQRHLAIGLREKPSPRRPSPGAVVRCRWPCT